MKIFWFYFIGYPVLMGSLTYYTYSLGVYEGNEILLIPVISFLGVIWAGMSAVFYSQGKEQ